MKRLIAGINQMPQMKIYGITDPSCFDWRCPTLAIRVVNQTADQTPLALATKLGEQGFFTWDGNYYALNLTEQLDVEKSGGFLRIGLVHYNTAEEVDRLLAALEEIVGK
jgi:selenocysteine lyase/cysteine desulfurase